MAPCPSLTLDENPEWADADVPLEPFRFDEDEDKSGAAFFSSSPRKADPPAFSSSPSPKPYSHEGPRSSYDASRSSPSRPSYEQTKKRAPV